MITPSGAWIDTIIQWKASLLDITGKLIDFPVMASTNKLEIYTSVRELYTTMSWVFQASSDFLDDFTVNNISIGTSFYFEFISDRGPTTTNMEFKVLSITNGPGISATTLGTTYNLLLVSPWYFSQYLSSNAYYGNIPTILTQMFKNDNIYTSSTSINPLTLLRIGGISVDSLDSSTLSKASSDPPAPRWRTMMKQGEFIQKRLRKYYRGINNTSTFMFTNTDDAFDVISYSDMEKTDSYVAVDYSNPQISAYADQMNDPYLSQFILFPHQIILGINATESKNLWDISSQALIYFSRDGGYVKAYNDAPILPPLGNDKTGKFTFVNSNKSNAYITKLYSDDTLHDFDDLFNMKNNEYNEDLLKAHTLTLVCYANLSVLAGRKCTLQISQSDGSPTVFAQDYIITEIVHLFGGNNKKKSALAAAKTILTLQTTSFGYQDNTSISGLYTGLSHQTPTSGITGSQLAGL
jgi:hypothetical protein